LESGYSWQFRRYSNLCTKMTEKKTPISEHKDKDVKLLRKTLLAFIEDQDLPKKDRTEACKLLARLHHALQVDRTITAKAVATQAQKMEAKLSVADEKELQALLNA